MIYCIGRDITERKRAEEYLRESEEKYRSVIENANLGIIVIQDGHRVFHNSRIRDIYGYTEKEYNEIDFMSIVHPEDRSFVADRIRRRLAGESTDLNIIEIRTISKSGEMIWVEANSTVIQWEGRPAVQAFVADITERKKAEEQLLEYQARLKAMASQLSSIQEHQRRQLAVELHDRVAQKLTMTKLSLETLARSFAEAGASEKVKAIAQQVGETIEDSYSLVLDLSNPVLYEIGLKAGVDALLQSDFVKHCGIECRLIAPKESMGIDTDSRVVLYQAIRELLVNAIKHSKAREIEILLRRTDDAATATVVDDGVGFEPSQVKPPGKAGGFGLFNIRENIAGLGGEFTIDSQLGKGTSAIICVPLPQEDTSKEGLDSYIQGTRVPNRPFEEERYQGHKGFML